jgi:hypothetical protein
MAGRLRREHEGHSGGAQRLCVAPTSAMPFCCPLLHLSTSRERDGQPTRQILTRIHPLHAIRKRIIRNQIISSPSRICQDSMSLHQPQCQTTRDHEAGELHCSLSYASNSPQPCMCMTVDIQYRLTPVVDFWNSVLGIERRAKRVQLGRVSMRSSRRVQSWLPSWPAAPFCALWLLVLTSSACMVGGCQHISAHHSRCASRRVLLKIHTNHRSRECSSG